MSRYIHRSKYFCGNLVSDYGLENHKVDYATLAKSFDAVINNEILPATTSSGIGEWELINGHDFYYEDDDGNIIDEADYFDLDEDEQDNYCEKCDEVFQWFIISESGANILQDTTNEIVYHNEELEMYLWGVTHWGTSWDYVLTDIEIDLEDDNETR